MDLLLVLLESVYQSFFFFFELIIIYSKTFSKSFISKQTHQISQLLCLFFPYPLYFSCFKDKESELWRMWEGLCYLHQKITTFVPHADITPYNGIVNLVTHLWISDVPDITKKNWINNWKHLELFKQLSSPNRHQSPKYLAIFSWFRA